MDNFPVDSKERHLIGYSSRVLQDYRKRYTQIEKETLSIVFGVESSWHATHPPSLLEKSLLGEWVRNFSFSRGGGKFVGDIIFKN